MTDKVQKIREEVEKLHGNPYYMMAVKDVLEIIDVQEKPVSGGLDEVASNYSEEHRIALMDYETGEIEMNKSLDILNAFKAGAEWCKKHQAEKDLELTWEDMMLIHKCIKDAMNYHLYKMIEGVEGQKVVYQEVLKRFKEKKGKGV